MERGDKVKENSEQESSTEGIILENKPQIQNVNQEVKEEEKKEIKENEIKNDMKETEDNMKIKLEKLKKQKEDDKIFCQDLERTEEKNP